jgi:hypothetical protein
MRRQVQKSAARREDSALTDCLDQGDARPEPESKRRRVALACNVCRGRKSRVSYVCLEEQLSAYGLTYHLQV